MPDTRITDPETRFLCIATAAFNLEGIVAGELKRLGLTDARGEQGAVRFHATLAEAYLACLRLRSADRVMLVLAEGECRTFEELFQLTRTVDWAAYLTRDAQINVSGKCARSQLMSVRDCQAITKKAIVERLKRHYKTQWFDETGPAPFQPQTEAQLLARIDHSLAQIEKGEFSDAEEVENELLAEIDS